MSFAPLVAALLTLGAPAAPIRPTLIVAVPAARTVGDVPQRVQAAFEQALVAETRKLEGVTALGAAEIGEQLASAAEGRMRGCTQDDACLLEVASALGIAELLSVEILAEGDDYGISFRRLSAKTGRPVATDRTRVKRGDGTELLQSVGKIVQVLYPDRQVRPGLGRGPDPELVRRLNPPPLPRWVFAATASAAAVTLGAGATFGLMAKSDKEELQELSDRSATEVVPGSEIQAAQDSLDTHAQMANSFFIAGAVLGTAAIVEGFFTDWHDYRAQVVVAPAPGGAQVAITGRF